MQCNYKLKALAAKWLQTKTIGDIARRFNEKRAAIGKRILKLYKMAHKKKLENEGENKSKSFSFRGSGKREREKEN